MIPFDPKPLVSRAIARGWIKPSPPEPESILRGDPYARARMRRLAAERRAQGLTTKGKPRTRVSNRLKPYFQFPCQQFP